MRGLLSQPINAIDGASRDQKGNENGSGYCFSFYSNSLDPRAGSGSVGNNESVESLFFDHINVLLLQAPGNAFEARATQYIPTRLSENDLASLSVIELNRT